VLRFYFFSVTTAASKGKAKAQAAAKDSDEFVHVIADAALTREMVKELVEQTGATVRHVM
jgi:deoxyxylulose-5-phosphate synthase